jgi:hypothetical protein
MHAFRKPARACAHVWTTAGFDVRRCIVPPVYDEPPSALRAPRSEMLNSRKYQAGLPGDCVSGNSAPAGPGHVLPAPQLTNCAVTPPAHGDGQYAGEAEEGRAAGEGAGGGTSAPAGAANTTGQHQQMRFAH